jgi:HEAT repeat protein
MNKKLFIIFLLVFSASLACGDSQEDKIDISDIKDASSLWRIFLDDPDSKTGVDILINLGTLGKGNRSIIDNLNNYLMGKNLLFRSGESVNYMVVSACVSAIMELGDSSSYPALFSVLYAGYPEVIASEAQGALEVIPGNLRQFLINVISHNPPEEKFTAFITGANSDRLNISQRGQLAELALEQGLNTVEENFDMSAMRYSAVLLLTQLRWTRANSLAIRHYYRVQSDYLQNVTPKERFIEAIACLGAVGNSDAALVLGLQLGLINAKTESTGTYDAEITMAIVQALGNIGYNAAFDHLLYVSYLSYPEEIQAAAREAVARLKW